MGRVNTCMALVSMNPCPSPPSGRRAVILPITWARSPNLRRVPARAPPSIATIPMANCSQAVPPCRQTPSHTRPAKTTGQGCITTGPGSMIHHWGIFISQDPLGDAMRYVKGNPINYVDPMGLDNTIQTGNKNNNQNNNSQQNQNNNNNKKQQKQVQIPVAFPKSLPEEGITPE